MRSRHGCPDLSIPSTPPHARGSVSRQPIDLEGHRGPLCGSRADDPLGWTHHPGIVVPLDRRPRHTSVGCRADFDQEHSCRAPRGDPSSFGTRSDRVGHGAAGFGHRPVVLGMERSGASPGSLGHHFAVRFASRQPRGQRTHWQSHGAVNWHWHRRHGHAAARDVKHVGREQAGAEDGSFEHLVPGDPCGARAELHPRQGACWRGRHTGGQPRPGHRLGG